MEPLEAAIASGDAVNGLASHFMLDMETYAHGGQLGFAGLDFYIAGRGGALGEVPASVVTAAMVFWSPEVVEEAWERSASVMSRREAAEAFAEVGHRWAETHLPAHLDVARLAELAGRVGDGASVAGAPLFAGWRALPEPGADRPAALALHRMNALRELRGALHGAAVVTQGISPHAAVAHTSPHMLDLFGWPAPHPEKAVVHEAWAAAQAATEVALTHAFAGLTGPERAEFVDLADAAQAAIAAG